MPRIQATRIAAQAVSNWKSAAEFLIWIPSCCCEPPKYSPTIAPIIASTHATLSDVNTYGSDAGMRTRRKTAVLPAAYERMSSICCGFTDVKPRSVLTSTGKKQSSAAMKIFELFSIPNQALAIGANAMIGMALAATKYGISAVPRGRNRASTSAAASPQETPTTKPQKASVNVYQPAGQRTLR